MEQVRLFIAIELPEEVKIGLKLVQDRLKSGDPAHAKWVDPNGIHLTLKFLGNVDVKKVNAITQALQEAAGPFAPLVLMISGLGCFPNMRRVQIVWVGLSGDVEKLQLLQKNVESSIAPLGFPAEKRPFTPHLTLARVREYASPEQRQGLGETVAKIKIESSLVIKVNSVSLMRSQLTPSGAFYTQLCSVKLNSPC